MDWLFLAVSLVVGVLVANVWRPARREPLTVVSFALAMVPAELPVHLAVLDVAVAVLCVAVGALHHWPGWVGLVVAVVDLGGLVGVAAVAFRSGRVIERSLDEATGGPLGTRGMPSPRWATATKLVTAVPIRMRSVRKIRNVDYWGDGIHRHRLDVLLPRRPRSEAAPVLVYVHGGAWVIGEKREQGIPMMHELVRHGWVCVTINYRLSPRATWPDQIVDCKRAVAWVKEHAAQYGGDPEFVAISGGSAGGHLSSLLALTPDVAEWQPGFEDADTSVVACVPFYGVYDMTGDPEASGTFGPGLLELLEQRVMKVSIGEHRDVFDAASPDQRITPSAPPMFVLHGTHDTLVPVAVARRFVERLRSTSTAPAAYAELPLAQHAFDVLFSIRSRQATLGVVRFLEAVRSRART